jgi:hypothetical protein
MPESCDEREKKILAVLDREVSDGRAMAAAVCDMAERMFVEEKGFAAADLRRAVEFEVRLAGETARSMIDLLAYVAGREAMAVKCAAGSLDSRQRHAVAAARAFGAEPLPFAAVVDPASAVVLDVASGRVIGEGFASIPTKEQLAAMLAGRESKPLAPEKLEREKRILLAFDDIRCCIPQGADGGVSLEPDDSCNHG